MMEQQGQTAQIPEIVLDVPDMIRTNKKAIIISGKVIDSQYIQQVFIADRPYSIDSGKTNVAFSKELLFSEGEHCISITAKNLLGGSCTKTVKIQVDQTGPVIVIQKYVPGKKYRVY